MREAPVTAGALALVDDLLHGCQRRAEIGNGDQLRPVNSSGVAWARSEPTNTARSPSFRHQAA
jgi:hypothetical protein